jgi:Gram-negative bacterial TonB protein C-terminal
VQLSHILAVLAIVLLLARIAQPSDKKTVQPCQEEAVRLTSQEMSQRIVTRTPMMVQGHHARLAGSIELLVVVDEQGKPICISVVRGHPILTSTAISSVKDWRFRPYSMKGKCKKYSGSLVIDSKEFDVPD